LWLLPIATFSWASVDAFFGRRGRAICLAVMKGASLDIDETSRQGLLGFDMRRQIEFVCYA
jgi:hypothetical protein